MTTTTGSQIATAVETVWKAIQERHPDVPDVVVTIQAKDGIYGHFAYNRWSNNEGTIDELFLNGEYINRGAVPTLGTLLHEAAHGVAKTRGIQDTSRQGRYHNKRFRTLACELGIHVENAGNIGWSKTSVPTETQNTYANELAILQAAISTSRLSEAHTLTTRTNNSLRIQCSCGRILRGAPTTIRQGAITCTICDTPFT